MGAHAVKMPVGTRKTVSIILVIAVMVLTLGTIDQSRKLVTFSGERMKSDAIGVDKFYTLRGNQISQPVGALNSKKSATSKPILSITTTTASPNLFESARHPLFTDLGTDATSRGEEFRCSSCAVVSASGFLLNSSAGRSIDAHACVIRINTSPVAGFEADVGARTTIRFVSQVSAKWFVEGGQLRSDLSAANGALKAVILTMPREYDSGAAAVKSLSKSFNEKSSATSTASNSASLYVSTKAAFVDTSRQWRAMTNRSTAIMSTGYRAVYFARHFCGSITMFGFIDAGWCARYGVRRHRVPYHYFASSKVPLAKSFECDVYENVVRLNRPNHQHDFIVEKKLFKALALIRRPPITFVRPRWNLTFFQP